MTSLAMLVISSGSVFAAEAESCKNVRMAEPGWNDLAFTTGVASVLLDGLGYKPKSSLLGVDIIYSSLKSNDLDVFLGYWDPAMVTYFKPYSTDGSIENVRVNLEGAKYTFAVPTYVWEAGVKDFSDLQKFADKFEKKMYGIEPGSNQLMIDVTKDPKLGLADWTVVESSEAGMLSEVMRVVPSKKFIVFQGWAPHPMNTKIDLKYLTGGDQFYGPNFGAATVTTQVRKGYQTECPNVSKMLSNLSFDIDFENKGMGYLVDDSLNPEEAAIKAIVADPKRLDAWLANVTTFDGKSGIEAVKAKLGL